MRVLMCARCRIEEYLELPARVELLNSRFTVLQEMLDMLRDHQVGHPHTISCFHGALIAFLTV